MTARRVVCWRHGQTEFNITGVIQGSTDTALDEAGHAQVAAAAAAIAELGPVAIVSSDLIRARQTASYLAEKTGLDVQLDPRLQERAFGDWEGLAVTDVAKRWPAESAAWRAGQDVPSVGMEGREAAATRYAAALRDAAKTVDDDGILVVVSHGGVTVCGLTALLGLDTATWRGLRVMANAHWAMLDRTSGGPAGWRLAAYNLGVTKAGESISRWF
ncbi:MAG: histidine phosphatase family protein [Micrococcales bacterium]|nr:histidine phosphatase family protein [Micrococcales bacterium]